ncbi:MAG: rhomboid family intramembrane serine protease [Gemmatimonadetes bacterium]|nr:MAG: rhomboid family intramembrane serine protease [Gemmatimonadota bacterium]
MPRLRVTYNAPVILTFSLLCVSVLIIDKLIGIAPVLFAAPPRGMFSMTNPFDYFRLFSHILGHSGWTHLAGNFYLILLIGPILEEKYGSFNLLLMILFTAFITGVLNALLFPAGLMGASGIAFMLILLSPFTSTKPGEIPLTFILIVLLYLTREVFQAFEPDNVSQFAHLIGGVVGSVFGFVGLQREGRIETTPVPPLDSNSDEKDDVTL